MKRTKAKRYPVGSTLFMTALAAAGFALRGRATMTGAAATGPASATGMSPHDTQATDGTSGPAAGDRPPGASATTPSAIPMRGWWQILVRVYHQVSDDRIMAEAAGVTFYALLAIFPALTALVSLYGLIADPSTISANLSAVSGFLPEGGVQIVHDQLKSLTSGPHKALGFGALVGLLTSLWSANAGIKSLFDALNVVYDEKEKRSFLRRTMVTFAFTLGGIVFVIVALTGVVVVPAVLHFLALDNTASTLLKLARWPVLFMVLSVFLAAVYRFGPSRRLARWSWVSWGGSAATLLWLIVSLAFSYYVSHFGNYNKTYGALGAAIGFMTWIWLSVTVVLAGAELNAEMEHQTRRDTTVGAEQPPGQRDATKADHVALG